MTPTESAAKELTVEKVVEKLEGWAEQPTTMHYFKKELLEMAAAISKHFATATTGDGSDKQGGDEHGNPTRADYRQHEEFLEANPQCKPKSAPLEPAGWEGGEATKNPLFISRFFDPINRATPVPLDAAPSGPAAEGEQDLDGGPIFHCGDCGARMTLVRPGKHQCDNEACPGNQVKG